MFREKCRDLGLVLKTHCVNGELLVKANFPLPELFELTESIFFEIEGLLVPFFIEEYSISSIDSLIIKLKDVNNKNKAIRFITCNVFIEEDEKNTNVIPKKDDIIGYSLINQDGEKLGEISGVEDIPGNVLLVVQIRNKEVLIPFNEKLLISINKKKKSISLKIDDGLLDLN